MKKQENMFTIQLQEGQNCTLLNCSEKNGITEYELQFSWTAENAARNDSFTVTWPEPYQNEMYRWDVCHGVNPCIISSFQSMLSKDAPISAWFDGKDQNCYSWALSECKKLISINNLIDSGRGIISVFSFGTMQFTNQYETRISLRIDRRQISLRQTVREMADWWSDICGITPANVPPAAKDPLYSFWYSYGQKINANNVEEECRRAKDLGFEVCIVDDGWQTDTYGGYSYCGDWEPAPTKFPDMAAHVRQIHDIGMKYILWYSVPFIGIFSKNRERFQNKLLRNWIEPDTGILDPRYREVREFLVDIYKKALVDWDLDGFKLDFIDEWREDPANAPYNEEMDIPALQDAVEVCMREVFTQLEKIKPDIMLEFRQRYVGPYMKNFGNMFRVVDCPGDYLYNRNSILNMRMFMGNQAVHSDMLMMMPHETPEKNALQIISCMFGVLQFSGRLDRLPENTQKMSRFWLAFLKEHKDLLLSENLKTFEAHLHYTWAMNTNDRECAVSVYSIDKCIKPEARDTIYIANGCFGERVFMELNGRYKIQVLDCYGNEIECGIKTFSGFSVQPVPVGGLIILKKDVF